MKALIASYSLLAIERDRSSPVDLKENHSLETLDGVVNVNRKGTAVLVGHIQEPIETVKAEGSNRSLKIKREKFAKGLIGVSGDDDGYKKTLGTKARNPARVQCHEDESRRGNDVQDIARRQTAQISGLCNLRRL
jgi:hypothetical protein